MNRVAENDPPPASRLGTDPKDWTRVWNLVRADANISRDILINGIATTLELALNAKTGMITAVGDIPPAFAGVELELKGTQLPELEAANLGALPVYNQALESHFVNALDNHIIPYLQADMQKSNGGDLVRLEGVITIRCCWPQEGTRLAELNPKPHFVKTDVRLYQFEEGVMDGNHPSASSSTLLVIWAPDSPRLPINPDGTAMGIA